MIVRDPILSRKYRVSNGSPELRTFSSWSMFSIPTSMRFFVVLDRSTLSSVGLHNRYLTANLRLGGELTLDQLCPLLVLATDWGFDHFRRYAIEEIPKHKMDSVPKIRLARRTHVAQWLQEEYVRLSTRLRLLSSAEIDFLGTEATTGIVRARHAVFARRMRLIRGDTPPAWMGGSFYHSGCWKVLVDAWDETFTTSSTLPRSADLTPVDTICQKLRSWRLQADENPDDRTARKLCKACHTKEAMLRDWASRCLEKDSEIARRELEAELGTNISD